jgi:hypothetical protein
MSTTRNAAGRTGTIFDYSETAKAAKLSVATLSALETEAHREFPNDPMLMELHVLRAIKAHAGKMRRGDKT